jgi:hypothetical protein
VILLSLISKLRTYIDVIVQVTMSFDYFNEPYIIVAVYNGGFSLKFSYDF